MMGKESDPHQQHIEQLVGDIYKQFDGLLFEGQETTEMLHPLEPTLMPVSEPDVRSTVGIVNRDTYFQLATFTRGEDEEQVTVRQLRRLFYNWSVTKVIEFAGDDPRVLATPTLDRKGAVSWIGTDDSRLLRTARIVDIQVDDIGQIMSILEDMQFVRDKNLDRVCRVERGYIEKMYRKARVQETASVLGSLARGA